MVSRAHGTPEIVQSSRQLNGTPAKGRGNKASSSPAKKEERTSKAVAQDVAELKDYQLGDCLGKGAFGSVYRALNWGTGETVAVKQIKLTDLPKSELRVIMLEIDLLKNLDHRNIVKYHGFVKSTETLNIILEYCENGSLHSISKNFGRFPENLVALYMSQVLHGLLYLHDQGVIHRDIKGANILTTKQGLVKLADFGVASRTTGLHESSVVGTPYWMAPEVIELSGATTASDIWSLGCTVIELLEGKPPYYKLQPMPALFRIVNDDHPPLPQGASPAVRDFLMQCFQKDPNLRVSAKKLLKHPWIVSARRSDSVIPKKSTEYEEAVKSVQEWNEALRSPNAGSFKKSSRPTSGAPPPGRKELPKLTTVSKELHSVPKPKSTAEKFRSPEGIADDNWDDDFASAISPSALRLPHLRPQDNFGGMLSSEKLKAFASFESVTELDTFDLGIESELTVKSPLQPDQSDLLQTIRPIQSKKTQPERNGVKSPDKAKQRKTSATISRPRGTSKTQAQPVKQISQARPPMFYRENSVEDYSDLIAANDAVLERKLAMIKSEETSPPEALRSLNSKSDVQISFPIRPGGSLRRQPQPRRKLSLRRIRSEVEIEKYAENENDEDFSDIFGDSPRTLDKTESDDGSDRSTLLLNSKLSNNSWLGDVDDEDDPFAQLEEGFEEMDLDANIQRDKVARLRNQVEILVGSLKTWQDDEVLADTSEQLLAVFSDLPETKSLIINAHGMLPILEILDTCKRRDIIFPLLKVVNAIIYNDYQIQENLCFVGGIPIINKFASKKYPREIRLEAAAFVRQMYQTSTLTLQMFVSAGGLNVLVEFLEDDYEDERDLVLIGVNGIWSVFELQGSTPKNDFCRILSRNSVLDPLSLALSRVLDEQTELAELCEGRIANIFFLFSQAENHVKEVVADRTVLHRVLKELKRMTPTHQITMLKFIKNLSMLSTTLDSLQNSNAIDVLTELLSSSLEKAHFREMSNQILNTIYNLCRLSKSRQEDAALNGIIPLLLKIVKTERPLKEFALPILCDMAHSGKVGRRELWRNKGLAFYISLLSDPYWQVTALDAIFAWLQEETARVEEHLLDGSFTDAIVKCFNISKANAFENLLEPLQKLLRLSPQVAASLAREDLFSRIVQKLHHNKAAIRLNLLRIVRSICDYSEEQAGLLSQYHLLDVIQDLEKNDPAVLVRNMAGELVKSCEELDGKSGTKRRALRRTSASTTPPSLMSTHSMPSTPQLGRSTPSLTSLNMQETPRHRKPVTSSLAIRPVSRDGSGPAGFSGLNSETGNTAKSRLPRTASHRLARQSTPTIGGAREENRTPVSARPPSSIATANANARRRRQQSVDLQSS